MRVRGSSSDTTQGELPPGFQTAEFLPGLHGLIDAIVSRKDMKKQLIEYLDFMGTGRRETAAG